MTKKNIWSIINWNKLMFSQDTLPASKTVHGQVYLDNSAWSVVLEFESSPREEGFCSVAQISFLVDSAPEHVLQKGFIFAIYSGAKVISTGEVMLVD